MTEEKRLSGRKIVIFLFSGVILLWLILFSFAYVHKQKLKAELAEREKFTLGQLWSHPDSVKQAMSSLPKTWQQITHIEGQGYVIFVPCFDSTGFLSMDTLSSFPILNSNRFDSNTEVTIKELRKFHQDGHWEIPLGENAAPAQIWPVTDSLLKNYPDAPFRDYLLRIVNHAGDTLLFTPQTSAQEFETLKAEDESPEGCREGGSENGD